MSDLNNIQPKDEASDDTPVEGTTLDEGLEKPAGQQPFAEEVAKDAKPKGNLHELVDEPAKVMRIGTMARGRLAEIHERSIKELEDGLAPELIEELERISLPFPDEKAPSDAELRIAQAQLVGWLEGLFHGIQAAIAAQQAAKEHAAAQMQLRQLPPGTFIAPGIVIGENGQPQRAAAPGAPGAASQGRREDPDHGPGQYL
jgi:hypothetical protein